MRLRATIALILACSLPASAQSTLTVAPASPVAGHALAIRYSAAASFKPAPGESVVVEILAAGDSPIVIDVPLRRKDPEFSGTFRVPDGAQALFARIAIGQRVDDHGHHAWTFAVQNMSGTTVPGAHRHRAFAARNGEILGFPRRRDLAEAREAIDAERSLAPLSAAAWSEHWKILEEESGESAAVVIRFELDSLFSLLSDRQEELTTLLPWFDRTGRPERREELEDLWSGRDPLGPVARNAAWRKATAASGPRRRFEAMERVVRDLLITPDDATMQALVREAIAAGRWDRADELIHTMPRKEPLLLISLAMRLIAARTTLDRASVLAKEAVNAARNFDPALKPAILSLREYRNQRAFELPMALGTYGDALRALGYPELAEKVYHEAVNLTDGKDADLARRLNDVRTLIKSEH